MISYGQLGYAAVAAGERWGVRWCSGCQRRRMMPETERVCLSCQETGGRKHPRVLHLPNLRSVRERAGITREELEALAGISRFRLHLMEEGQRRVKVRTTRRIAGALGTTVAALTSETDEGTALRHTTAATLSAKGAA